MAVARKTGDVGGLDTTNHDLHGPWRSANLAKCEGQCLLHVGGDHQKQRVVNAAILPINADDLQRHIRPLRVASFAICEQQFAYTM